MRIYEYEAKQVFDRAAIPVPKVYGVVKDPAGIPALPEFPVMVKAQALVGGRGKAGGVVKAKTEDEAREAIVRILGSTIKGYPVTAVLVEQALPFSGACYVGLTVNPATSNIVFMVSAAGGVEIEQVAVNQPDAILRIELPDSPDTLPEAEARKAASFLVQGLGGIETLLAPLQDVCTKLYNLYQATDAKVLEINPLLITPEGPVAADGKLVLDDNALWRQGDLLRVLGITGKRHEVSEPTSWERRAAKGGFTFVDLLPEGAEKQPGRLYVGLVPGGAGYGIFSIDEVTNVGDRFFGGKVVPINFMDSGGGPSKKGVAEMFALLMDHPLVDVIVTSRFGGISSCDIFIRGLVDCLRQRYAAGQRVVPVYGRMVGTDLAAARQYLIEAARETPEPLQYLDMVVGNQKIMADVIRDGLADYFRKHPELGVSEEVA